MKSNNKKNKNQFTRHMKKHKNIIWKIHVVFLDEENLQKIYEN